jgi:plasmid stabilization system protein ParE
MSARYLLSALAEEDFAGILYGIAETSGWSRSMDEEQKLYEAFRSLALNPGIGHLREDLLPRHVYFFYSAPYLILYLRDTEPLSIIAIIHGARDLPLVMKDRH